MSKYTHRLYLLTRSTHTQKSSKNQDLYSWNILEQTQFVLGFILPWREGFEHLRICYPKRTLSFPNLFRPCNRRCLQRISSNTDHRLRGVAKPQPKEAHPSRKLYHRTLLKQDSMEGEILREGKCLRDQIKGVIPSNQMTRRKVLHLGLNQCIVLCTYQQMRRAENTQQPNTNLNRTGFITHEREDIYHIWEGINFSVTGSKKPKLPNQTEQPNTNLTQEAKNQWPLYVEKKTEERNNWTEPNNQISIDSKMYKT